MIEYWLFLIVSVVAMFLWGMFWDQERQLRHLYRMFGTTGFWDVDARLRESRMSDEQA